MKELKQIKVSGSTSVHQLASSIVKFINEGYDIEVRALGASAVNQMYKGVTIARGTVAQKGKDLLIKPGFADVTETDKDGNDKSKTVMVAHLVIG